MNHATSEQWEERITKNRDQDVWSVYYQNSSFVLCMYFIYERHLYVACDEGWRGLNQCLIKLYFRSLQCSQSGVDDVEAVVEVGQLVEQQPGPGAGQGAGRAGDHVVPAPPTGLG